MPRPPPLQVAAEGSEIPIGGEVHEYLRKKRKTPAARRPGFPAMVSRPVFASQAKTLYGFSATSELSGVANLREIVVVTDNDLEGKKALLRPDPPRVQAACVHEAGVMVLASNRETLARGVEVLLSLWEEGSYRGCVRSHRFRTGRCLVAR